MNRKMSFLWLSQTVAFLTIGLFCSPAEANWNELFVRALKSLEGQDNSSRSFKPDNPASISLPIYQLEIERLKEVQKKLTAMGRAASPRTRKSESPRSKPNIHLNIRNTSDTAVLELPQELALSNGQSTFPIQEIRKIYHELFTGESTTLDKHYLSLEDALLLLGLVDLEPVALKFVDGYSRKVRSLHEINERSGFQADRIPSDDPYVTLLGLIHAFAHALDRFEEKSETPEPIRTTAHEVVEIFFPLVIDHLVTKILEDVSESDWRSFIEEMVADSGSDEWTAIEGLARFNHLVPSSRDRSCAPQEIALILNVLEAAEITNDRVARLIQSSVAVSLARRIIKFHKGKKDELKRTVSALNESVDNYTNRLEKHRNWASAAGFFFAIAATALYFLAPEDETSITRTYMLGTSLGSFVGLKASIIYSFWRVMGKSKNQPTVSDEQKELSTLVDRLESLEKHTCNWLLSRTPFVPASGWKKAP